uniref:Arrestin C-terminal-like domain-containing protein n=1 Tax=Kalmanozyma brasiliensis (strain GHG001) TaxID=1365824 RepID=V5GFC3_KALBG
MTYDAGLSVVPHEIVALDQEHDLGANDLSAFDSKMDTGSDNATERTGGKARNRLQKSLSEANITGALLGRQSTLFSATANPLRRSKDLDRLLGNSDRKLPSSAARQVISEGHTKGVLKRSNAVAATGPLPPPALEQGKASKARVEVDLVLESDLVVEGGTLQGRMQIRIRKGSVKEGAVLLAQPKVRIVGFEELLTDDTRHIFYHHASLIDGDSSRDNVHRHGSPTFASPETAAFPALPCYAGAPDAEGYAVGKIGIHSIPFSLDLPIAKGAKGSYRCKHAVVRYIVIGSVKLKSTSGADRSIAHFYRHIDVYPYFNPAVILSKAVQPIQASSSKGLFLGGSGKVHLMASLHRSTWVAGQRLYVNIAIQNDTSKKINGMSLSLMRTVTLYKPRPELELDGHRARKDIDPDACQTSTNRKKIAEEQLEMGQKGSKGAVTARGWWVGVEPGQRVESSHHMLIPADAMSISRGRLVEVVYSIKVSIGSSLSSDVSVELPVRVVNFVSLDPPPLKKAGAPPLVAVLT